MYTTSTRAAEFGPYFSIRGLCFRRAKASKYSIAKQCIADALAAASKENIHDSDALEALIISAIAKITETAGAERIAEIIHYELRNLSGALDKDFLRAR
ncbi:hypothetical protein FX988_03121 [Paraglaciecola mesophila]|uniref:Uncharacterized protein n=1 Tax=Paraglaciecola mesophila TaxID=197222 RepID=A0A857JLV6_9ALTE|nr:hypothetical protein [Paraglaciecola mesophila]QHJ12863.1 hypothetical protein FX988_03121 [Paraglaciecola mesophila]